MQPNRIKFRRTLLVWHVQVASLPVPGLRRVPLLPRCTNSSDASPPPSSQDPIVRGAKTRASQRSARSLTRPFSRFAATSTAPQIGRKRRFSSTEPDDDEPSASTSKRHRLDTIEPELDASSRREDAEGVKEVTKGVQEVEIEEEKKDDVAATPSDAPAVSAAAVPLPESPVLEAHQETADSDVKDVEEEGSAAKVEEETESKQEAPVAETAEAPELVNGVHEGDEATEGESAAPGLEAPAPTATTITSEPLAPSQENEAATAAPAEVVEPKDVVSKKIPETVDSIQAH
ncbi:hypothetical protein EIP91_003469 [Steccherinum ochraceum]|uniref:Uncharacterized protein n=1 Tax=Steccherinum ochraceum TaxID=92696 RepID=A0A4R0RDV4_9APHY|nr:hypothetical protein EIP91_003469 [Steccherinum ochraceum]